MAVLLLEFTVDLSFKTSLLWPDPPQRKLGHTAMCGFKWGCDAMPDFSLLITILMRLGAPRVLI